MRRFWVLLFLPVLAFADGPAFLAPPPSSVNGTGTSSQAMTAPSYTATAGSGSDAYKVSTSGARWHLGTGSTDYCTSDGSTTITCAGVLQSGGNLIAGAAITAATGFFSNNGTYNGNGGNASLQAIGAKTDGAGVIAVKLENANALTAGTDRDAVGIYRDSGSTLVAEVTSNGTYKPASGGGYMLANIAAVNTAPTISSGFGTSPSVTTSNGTAAFTINVGTGGVATSGVVGFPTATNGWVCNCTDITTASATVFLTKQTASSTTSCTVGNFNTAGAAAAWVASDVLHCIAMGR